MDRIFNMIQTKQVMGRELMLSRLDLIKWKEMSYLQVVQMDCAWNSVKQLLCAISLLLPEDH